MKTILSIIIISLFLFPPSISVAELPDVHQSTFLSLSASDVFSPIQDFIITQPVQSVNINSSSTQLGQIKKPISLSLEDVSISSINENSTTLQLSDSIPFNQPNLPLLPMKTMRLSLQKDLIISDIRYENYIVHKSKVPLKFPTAPLPRFWSLNKTALHNHTYEIVQRTLSTYDNNSLYPGHSHSYIVGKNTTNTSIIIHLFPIQHDLNTYETYLISSGEIIVDYKHINPQENSELLLDNQIENIIITPVCFKNQAERLQQFHDTKGISTTVVTTNWIQTHYSPSDYPSVQGYKDFNFKDKILKYDDRLARQIISFLKSQQSNTHLKFITIFGNARHVPASYYFGEAYYPVPTDFYYSSPDLDLIPNYCVGRIPINSFHDANQVVDKIINWNPTIEQMDHVAIAGGIPFSTPFYIGELITIDSVNNGYLDGLTIQKFFRSDENFDSDDILQALEDDFGLLYMICHGSPFLIAVEEGRISANTINRMKKNTNAPILSCIACSSGSYDTRIIKQGKRLDKTSFGESIVLSKGGGIAYIGGSRTNDGYPVFDLINGRVVTSKETYMAGLLTLVNKAYQSNFGHLGELTLSASIQYLYENDMTDFWNLYHYFSFVLLGDPALSLPERTCSEIFYDQPISEIEKPIDDVKYNSDDESYQGTIPLYAIDETVLVACTTEAPTINVKSIETGKYAHIDGNINLIIEIENMSIFDLFIVSGDLLLLRFEINDGKEDWIYLKPIRPVDDDFDITTEGYQETRWSSIQNAIYCSNPNDPIYVLNGTYEESIWIDKPIYLAGEKAKQTIVDGRGYGDVVTIVSDGVKVSDLTIEHCGRKPWNAAIRIQPDTIWNPSPITIQQCKIQNNLHNGVYIDTSSKITSPCIRLFGNTIQYNNYGVYINPGYNKKEIYSNTIYGNNYGFYAVESQNDEILWNLFENNGVGMYLNMVKKINVENNGFVNNDQHCQFLDIKRCLFDANYWDNWIGHVIKIAQGAPKIINGIHDSEEPWLSQIRVDRHPNPYFTHNANFLKNYL